MKFSQSRRTGLLFGAGGIIVLSPDALLLRLFDGGDYAMIAGRGLALALLMGAAVVMLPMLRRGFSWRPTLLYALLYASGLLSFPLSVEYTHVANTLVIITVAPLLSAIGARIFLSEKIAKRTWWACIVAAMGVGIIFAPKLGGGALLGDAFALCAAFSLAGCAIIIRKHPHMDFSPGICLGAALVTVGFAPFANWEMTTLDVGVLALDGLVLFVAFLAIMAASHRLPPPEVNLLFLLEAVLAPLWVWMVFSEVPPSTTVAAGVLIGGVLSWHYIVAWRE
ncbi:MAG: DMT family transporter [Gammaproteobacteria bacterium WSBS_2016_MAG_OTU1]